MEERPMKDADTSRVLSNWSLTLMRRGFQDLALAFAAVDAEKADKAIHAIETLVAQQLTALRDEPPKGIAIPMSALKEIAENFRDMTQGARKEIREAAKPH
jgi:hypothetical protein